MDYVFIVLLIIGSLVIQDLGYQPLVRLPHPLGPDVYRRSIIFMVIGISMIIFAVAFLNAWIGFIVLTIPAAVSLSSSIKTLSEFRRYEKNKTET